MKNIFKISLVIIPILSILIIFNFASTCSSGWYVTGYYTPIETQFGGIPQEILVDKNRQNFKSDFVTEVKTEGWGKTVNGSYLGWYGDQFYLNNQPLDFEGNKLEIKAVAADISILPIGSKITIPNLPEPWNSYTFSVRDVGPSINEKHIDVYTGEGKAAKNITEQITSKGLTVCKIS